MALDTINLNTKPETSGSKNPWDDYWKVHFKNKTGQKLLFLLRTKLIARAVRHFIEIYFDDNGVFVEMGSGSSQTSALINKKYRKLYALDFAFDALDHAREIPVIDGGIQGNLFSLPFLSDSIDGIWNLGVMEHFTDSDINKIFAEFYRVLKPGSCAILFWPPLIGWYKAGSVILESILSVLKGKRIKLYPDEINLFRSKSKIDAFCNERGFVLEYCCSIHLDFFNHVVVVIRKHCN